MHDDTCARDSKSNTATWGRNPCTRGCTKCSGVAARRQRGMHGAGMASQHELCLSKKSLRCVGAKPSTGLRRALQCCMTEEHGILIGTSDLRMCVALKGMMQVNGFAKRKDFIERGWPQCSHRISPFSVMRCVRVTLCCDVRACDTVSLSGEAARVRRQLASLCCKFLTTQGVSAPKPC